MRRAMRRRPGTSPGSALVRLLPWAILIAGICVRFATHGVGARTPDEVFYSRYALAVAEQGPGYFPRFTREINDHPQAGSFSWPERAGYIALLASALKITGQEKGELGAYLSLIASVLVLVLVLTLGTRLADPWTTSAALLLAAVSPLDLAIARRTWSDSLVAMLMLTMFFACACFLVNPGRRRWPALFFLAGTYSLLVKESAWPVYLACTLVLAWAARGAQGLAGPVAARPRTMLALGALGVALAAAAIVLACGGPAEALRTWETARVANVPNEYMKLYQTGSPLYYFAGLGVLQPAAFAAGLLGAALAIVRPSWLTGRAAPGGEAVVRLLAWFAVGFLALAAAYPEKNLRFVSPLTAPLALLAALAIRAGTAALGARLPAARRWIPVVAGILIVASAALDLARFHDLFERRGLTDPVTPLLLRPPAPPP